VPEGGRVNVALQVFRIGQLVGDALDVALEPVELNGDQFAVLSVLRVWQPIKPAGLADVLKMPSSSLSRRLDRLERQGLLRRRTDESDGRAKVVELTPEGDRKVRACYPLFHEFVLSVEGRLGRRLGAIQDALDELQTALEDLQRASGRDPARASP
jgi:DNA-binding MarR family transcriptional regulator